MEGAKLIIPPDGHLVAARAVFLKPESQPADKDLFLLQVTHPSINQNSPEELKKSVAQALKTIKDDMKLQEQYHTTEMDSNYYNQYLASAPPHEEEQKEQEQGEAAGGTEKVKKEPTLSTKVGDKIPGAEKD